MQSLRYLYRIGNGPSSSHTMGPIAAVKRFLKESPEADSYRVVFYGSLAKTGVGHMSDVAVINAFGEKPCEKEFDYDAPTPVHPNTMDLIAVKDGVDVFRKRYYSIGGGEVLSDGETYETKNEVYPLSTFTEIAQHCQQQNAPLWTYVDECEGEEMWEYLAEVWKVMQAAISRGLSAEGVLHGGLGTQRKAKMLSKPSSKNENEETRHNRVICSYAYAVSEENAGGAIIATAPTCGACGVVPAVLKYLQETHGFTDTEILRALATAGIVGNLIKTNASISGAECGCQAEVGTACAMAAAAAAELLGMDINQIEYAAEMSIEHHLGLTCDPICGLVQIPCIERNAIAAMRALNAVNLASFIAYSRKISFDMIVNTMYETGKDLKVMYRETSEGGMAKNYKR